MEVFKKHPIFSNYVGSSYGRVFSKTSRKEILYVPDKDGYLKVMLYKNRFRRNYRVHRFIYECFNGIISNGLTVDHLDFTRDNNSIENLESVTIKENCIRRSCRKDKLWKSQKSILIA